MKDDDTRCLDQYRIEQQHLTVITRWSSALSPYALFFADEGCYELNIFADEGFTSLLHLNVIDFIAIYIDM